MLCVQTCSSDVAWSESDGRASASARIPQGAPSPRPGPPREKRFDIHLSFCAPPLRLILQIYSNSVRCAMSADIHANLIRHHPNSCSGTSNIRRTKSVSCTPDRRLCALNHSVAPEVAEKREIRFGALNSAAISLVPGELSDGSIGAVGTCLKLARGIGALLQIRLKWGSLFPTDPQHRP